MVCEARRDQAGASDVFAAGAGDNDSCRAREKAAVARLSPMIPHYQAGTLWLLARPQQGARRACQEIPTYQEAGIKGLVAGAVARRGRAGRHAGAINEPAQCRIKQGARRAAIRENSAGRESRSAARPTVRAALRRHDYEKIWRGWQRA